MAGTLVAGALAAPAALGTATAGAAAGGTAGAPNVAAPRGEVLATDALGVPVVDSPGGRVVFSTGLTTVASLDPATGTRVDADVAGVCPNAEQLPPRLQGAGGGFALVVCDGQRPQVDEQGTARYGNPIPAARVLSLTDGTAVVPLGLDKTGGLSAGVIYDRWISFRTGGVRSPYVYLRLDWRSGELTEGSAAPPALPGQPVAGALGARTVDSTRLLDVTLAACGATLRWEVSAIATAAPLIDALLVSDAERGGAPRTLTRVPLAGACERTVGHWGAATAAAGGRRVALAPASATVADPETAAVVSVAAPRSPRTLRVRPRAVVRFAPAVVAAGVRWQLDGGRWQRARGRERDWSLVLPGRLRRGTRTATIETRLADGGTVRHALRLTRAGSGR